MLLKILTVAGLATFEIYAAIPAGLAFGLSPWVIFLASLTGGIVGVYVTIFLGDKIKAFFAKYKKPKEEKPKTGLIYRIWNKYGVIGLGFLGTITVGAPISIPPAAMPAPEPNNPKPLRPTSPQRTKP